MSPLLVQLFTVIGTLPAHALDANTLPANGTVTHGVGAISQTSDNRVQVLQTSDRMVANWTSFNIGSNAAVEFVQPSARSVVLNRVNGSDPSQIWGRLTANGQVFLLNPNGILFGHGARIDVGGLTASSLSLSDADFLAGRYRFANGGGTGSVTNRGDITTRDGGYVVLLGRQVRNDGTIVARTGHIALGAGERVTLDFKGDGLVNLSVDQAVLDALVENTGALRADGGLVIMSARAADALPGMVLNQSGIIEARSIQERAGRIYLDGGERGTTHIGGTLDASGRNMNEKGGAITVIGDKIGLLPGAQLDASGHAGGGTVLVGGNWQGKGEERHASAVTMTPDARISADAHDMGDGGTVVLWSKDYTGFYGVISARGGNSGGNGGKVETSSHHNLQALGTVDAAALAGRSGNWLLDPADVTITSATSNGAFNSGNPNLFTPSAATANVNAATINASLNGGTDVTIQTSGAAGGNGDITVASAINKTAGGDATLKLLADRHIIVNASTGITSTSGKLNVLLNSRVTDGALGRISVNSPITTNGGSVSLVGASTAAGFAIGNTTAAGVTVNSAINAGGGDILIKGQGNASGTATIGIYSAAAIGTSGTGTLSLSGVGGSGGTLSSGVNLDTGSSLATGSGDITVTGSASDTAGTAFGTVLGGTGTRSLSSSGGNITINGAGNTAGHGLRIGAATTISTTGSGTITLSGTNNNSQHGLNVGGSITLSTVAGNIAMSGTSSSSIGMAFGTASTFLATSTSGDIILSGSSTNAAGLSSGLKIDPVFLTFSATSTNGNVSLTGTSAGARGYYQNGAAVSLTAGGNITVSGTGVNNNGILVSSNGATFSANATGNGNVTVTGTGNGTGSGLVVDSADATISSAGTGTITVNGYAGASGTYGMAFNPTAGTTKIYSTGGGNLTLAGTATAGSTAIYSPTACLGYDCAASGSTNNVSLSASSGAMNLGLVRAAGNFSATNSGTASTDTLNFNGNVTAAGTLTGHAVEGNLTLASGKTLTSNSAAANAIQLGAGTQHASADASAGNVILNGSLAAPSSRAVLWTGSIAGTATGTNFSTAAPAASGRFRYGRSWTDTTLLGNAPASGVLVQYREQPTLTLTMSNINRAYDGASLNNASFSQVTGNYSATGNVNGDTLASTGLSGSLAFAGSTGTAVRNAGTYAITQGSLSSLAGYGVALTTPVSYTISPLALTVAANSLTKTYDGTTGSSALPSITAGALVGGDSATLLQTFDNKNVGTGKVLTPALAISDGNNGNNYAVTAIGSTGTINKAALTVTASSVTKTYDGSTASSVLPTITSGAVAAGDSAALSQTFDTKNAGTGKTLTPVVTINDGNGGNNYTVTTVNTSGAINPATLIVTPAAISRTYDGTTLDNLNYSQSLDNYVVSGFATGENASHAGIALSGSMAFNGNTATAVRNAGSYTLGQGALALSTTNSNYTIKFTNTAPASYVITPRPITVAANADTKTYDASTASSVLPTITSGAVAASDSAALSQTFDTKNAGTGKTLTPVVTINDGNGGNNYTVTTVNTSGVINPATLIVTPTAISRTYDGTTLDNLNYSQSLDNYVVSGFATGENASHAGIALSGSMAFNGNTATAVRNAGSYTLGQGALALSTTNSNYTIKFTNTAPASYVITPRPITVAANADTKTYDASTASSVLPAITAGTLAGGDSATLSQAFDTKNAGTGKSLIPMIAIGDGNGGNNYAVTSVNDTTGSIKPRPITVALPSTSKLFGVADPAIDASQVRLLDGTLASTETLYSLLSTTIRRAPAENVGKYAYSIDLADSNGNYALGVSEGRFDINPNPKIGVTRIDTLTGALHDVRTGWPAVPSRAFTGFAGVICPEGEDCREAKSIADLRAPGSTPAAR